MAIKYKDYYEILGVKRDATEEQIRQAYRRLARKYHPDFNRGNKAAEEKFKEINEANEVLSDPQKRKRYDALGSNWKSGADFTPPPGWKQSSTVRDSGGVFSKGSFSDFFEAIFGSKVARNAVHASASQIADTELVISLETAHRGGINRILIRSQQACSACNGVGKSRSVVCHICRGSGAVLAPRAIDVNIPPGARDGSIIRVPAGKRGDFYIKLRIEPHSIFSVNGDDLQMELPIAPWEAVLGANVEVPTIDGKAQMKIPAGAQNGQRFRLRGQGLSKREGGRGDQYVKLKIVVPTNPTEQERQLYQQLAKVTRFNPRSSQSGFPP
jgi:curved DNA-binding protein